MNEREALKLALEALEGCEDVTADVLKAITAIKEALAQPKQEPKVWGLPNANGDILDVISPEEHERLEGGYTVALYTTPPQRTWVGLTRRERFEIEKAMSKYYDYQHECKTVCLPEFAAAIEAKLKEKNA